MRRWATAVLMLLLCGFVTETSPGFVLLSGPEEARLEGSPERPVVEFYWNGTAPRLNNIEELDGDQWIDMDDQTAMYSLISLAFQTWNEVPGSWVQLELRVDPDASLDPSDQRHSIVVQHETNLTTSAYAVPTIKGNRIVDCDISVSNRATSARSLAYTLIHEVGHCLGLGHAHSNYGAVMGYSRYSGGSLALGADDMAGLIWLYTDPAYDGGSGKFLACAGLGHNSGKHGRSAALFLLILPFLFLLLRVTLRVIRR